MLILFGYLFFVVWLYFVEVLVAISQEYYLGVIYQSIESINFSGTSNDKNKSRVQTVTPIVDKSFTLLNQF